MKMREFVNICSLRLIIILIGFAFGGATVVAQEVSPGEIERYKNYSYIYQWTLDNLIEIYAPEIVMKNQESIKLSDEQKKTIKSEILSRSARFTELQWDLQEATEALQKTLNEKNSIDEKKAVEHLNKILEIERETKSLRIGLLIKIRNLLTENQRIHLMILYEYVLAQRRANKKD